MAKMVRDDQGNELKRILLQVWDSDAAGPLMLRVRHDDEMIGPGALRCCRGCSGEGQDRELGRDGAMSRANARGLDRTQRWLGVRRPGR